MADTFGRSHSHAPWVSNFDAWLSAQMSPAAEAPPAQAPEPAPTPSPAPPAAFSPTPFRHVRLSMFPRRQFVYGRHLIRGFLSATVAPGGVGKSALAIVEAVSMASGRSLLGTRPREPLRVWYWNGEDPAQEIQRRVEATCLAFDLDPASIEDRLFIDSGRRTEIVLASQGKSGTLLADVAADALTDALRHASIDVLILDPFVSTHRVSENDNMAIDVVAKALGKLADRANCAVEAVHHVRKTGGAEITAEDSRGASSLIAAARSVRVLNPMTKDEAETSGVGEDRRFHFRADIDKSNLAPSTKVSWFRLANTGLGNGSGGPIDDQDYVGVPKPWEWPNALAGVTGADLATVQARVTQGRWRKDAQAKDWVGKAVAEALKLNLSSKRDRAKVKALLNAWLGSGALVEIEGLDDSRRKRIFVEAGCAQ